MGYVVAHCRRFIFRKVVGETYTQEEFEVCLTSAFDVTAKWSVS